ncbi:MAG: hypothetical protein KAG92_08115, partial [Deltaproteobacteria bacterium]|nr:hypothetical protein [Deltaproteobacteria bacterium]
MFLNDVARENIIFTKAGADLKINYGLDLQNQVVVVGNSIESFEMSDGSYVSREEIDATLAQISATTGIPVDLITADQITGNLELKSIQYNAWTDMFVELRGHDNGNNFTGSTENEKVFGGQSVDSLVGHSGNDILQGNGGDDKLNAGNGNDTYIFQRGDNNDIILDVEDPGAIVVNPYGGGGDFGDYQLASLHGAIIDDGNNGNSSVWSPKVSSAPSDDSLVFKGDISLEDLEAFWATADLDVGNNDANDLLLRVKSADSSVGWSNRDVNVDTIIAHYGAVTLTEWDGQANVERELTIDALTPYSDKALRQLTYQITAGNDAIANTTVYAAVVNFLSHTENKTTYFEEKRAEEDTVRIEQFYDKEYTIENIVLEAEGRSLTSNDIMALLSTGNSEMIRGVDWDDNTIAAGAGHDAVMGGELND